MKTKELIKKVEELGFDTRITGNTIYILKDDEKTIARVEIIARFTFDSFYLHNKPLNVETMEKLFDLIVEYAKTPIDEREEEKMFYLRHKFLCDNAGKNLFDVYLNYRFEDDNYFIYSFGQNEVVKSRFTLKEIEEIKEKFDTDLKDFEMIEVE